MKPIGLKMKRVYDRTVEGSSQSDVLIFMDIYPETWFTSEQIRDALNLKNREKVTKFLKKLVEFDFVERKRINGTNELLYKIKEIKKKPNVRKPRTRKK